VRLRDADGSRWSTAVRRRRSLYNVMAAALLIGADVTTAGMLQSFKRLHKYQVIRKGNNKM